MGGQSRRGIWDRIAGIFRINGRGRGFAEGVYEELEGGARVGGGLTGGEGSCSLGGYDESPFCSCCCCVWVGWVCF
jgi:hypothetical protein